MKFVWFISFIVLFYASIELMRYFIMPSLWWSIHKFETILSCDILPIFCILYLQKIEVTSIVNMIIGRLCFQDTIKCFLQANTTQVDDQFSDIELRAQIAVWCNMILLQHLKTTRVIKTFFILNLPITNLLFLVLPRYLPINIFLKI